MILLALDDFWAFFQSKAARLLDDMQDRGHIPAAQPANDREVALACRVAAGNFDEQIVANDGPRWPVGLRGHPLAPPA